MFKFDFDRAKSNFINPPKPSSNASDSDVFTAQPQEGTGELSLNHLLEALPSLISYSPLSIPVSSNRKSVTLIRRDLFDARFQLISESSRGESDSTIKESASSNSAESSQIEDDDKKALEFLDNPSDLVPGIYEGGLKTWECSLNLVDHLDSLKDRSDFQGFCGRKVLEIGCGTAVPSLFIFQELLSTPRYDSLVNVQKTEIHLQDYNEFVLQLITLPNLLTAWYASPHSSSYRDSFNDPDIASAIDPVLHGELSITPALKTAFVSSLESLNITFRFFVGSWTSFNSLTTYNLVLSSETIYRLENLLPLTDLMRAACLGSRASDMSMETCSPSHPQGKKNPDTSVTSGTGGEDYLCLVAAKVLYFGVGGGLSDFVEAVQNVGGTSEVVLERRVGVGRKVIRVLW